MPEMLSDSRQAGVDLKKLFSDLHVPKGLTIEDLIEAEDMVLDWQDGSDYRALALVSKLYEHLRARDRSGER